LKYEGQIPAEVKVYLDPRASVPQDICSRVGGLYLDLRGASKVSPADVVDALKSLGIDPKADPGLIEVVALIDPESPPEGLGLVGSLWRLVVALDIEHARSLLPLELAQRSFDDIAVRVDVNNIRLSLGVIAILAPSYTIIPSPSTEFLRDLKIYAGASAGMLLVELCSPEVPSAFPIHLIGGMALRRCG